MIRKQLDVSEWPFRQTDLVCRGSQENREGSEATLGKDKAASSQEIDIEQNYLHIRIPQC